MADMGNGEKIEKRKYLRFDCLLPAELIKINGKENIKKEITAQDISREGLRLSINFDINMGSTMVVKLLVPDRNLVIPVSGEIVWIRTIENKLEAGLRIKEMDPELKSELLNWVFPKWLEKERETGNKKGKDEKRKP